MTNLLNFRLNHFIHHFTASSQNIKFCSLVLLVFTCFSVEATLFEQNVLPFGYQLAASKKQLLTQCEDIEQTSFTSTFAKGSQTQLSCNNYQYLGHSHRLQLTYIDKRLEQIDILDMRSLLPEVKNGLTAVYGKPQHSSSKLDYFDEAGISLDVLSEKLTFLSPRLKSVFKQQLESAKHHAVKLTLRREQWLQDLTQLDRYIKERHINPFFHQSETGYLKLIGEARNYITHSELVDSNIVNGYIEQLVAYTGDGHSYVSGRAARYGELPFYLNWFGENLHITAIDEVNSDLLAARIIAIGGHDFDTVTQLLKPFTPSVNTSAFKRESIWLMRHPGLLFAASVSDSADEVELTLELTNGKKVSRRVKKIAVDDNKINYLVQRELKTVAKPLYRLKKSNNQWFEYLPEQNTIYFRYSLVAEKEKGNFSKMAQSLKAALDNLKPGKLVIDIRNNPGGNSYLNAPLINVIRNSQLINQRGKLFVLTNNKTFSAAINFAGNMEAQTRALFIGEKVGDTPLFTGESGPQARFQMPNSKIVANLSFSEWVSTFDFDQRDAVALDIPVTLSLTDFINGKDPVLQTALDYRASPISKVQLTVAQTALWLGRYDYSADKALRIFTQQDQLKMEITEQIFSNLYPVSNNEMITDISGLRLKKLASGELMLIHQGQAIHKLVRLAEHQLKPLELLVSGQFALAKTAYQLLHQQQPGYLPIRGNSLGILASHIRARYDSPTMYYQLREIALILYGYPVVSWDADDIAI